MGIGSRCGAAGPGLPTCSKYRPFFKKVKTEKKIKKTKDCSKDFIPFSSSLGNLKKTAKKKTLKKNASDFDPTASGCFFS